MNLLLNKTQYKELNEIGCLPDNVLIAEKIPLNEPNEKFMEYYLHRGNKHYFRGGHNKIMFEYRGKLPIQLKYKQKYLIRTTP